jgi:hypothetical protein
MWVWSENNERVRSWGMLLGSQHFGGRGACWSFRMGLGKNDKQLIHSLGFAQTKQHVGPCIVWALLSVKTSHEQPWTHKTHKTSHGPDLGKPPPSPLYYSLRLPTGATSKWHFIPGLPSGNLGIPTTGLPRLWGPITSCADLRFWWDLKQSCNPRREIFNDMSHTTYKLLKCEEIGLIPEF